MELKNLNFETWLERHSHIPPEEKAYYRELYPFEVFQKIDFDEKMKNVEQKINYNNVEYCIEIKELYQQIDRPDPIENRRYVAVFQLSNILDSEKIKWRNRVWKERFQIVYEPDYRFVTVYTKKDDLSKEYLQKFKNGNFSKINNIRSIPVSKFLFRTLIRELSKETYPGGKEYQTYPYEPEGIIQLPVNPQFENNGQPFSPIYSNNRDLWIHYSFTEEKAHRLAFYIANQCQELIIVFCKPTLTKYHKCSYSNVHIWSLFDFTENISPDIRKKYEKQVRFLLNHLNLPEAYDIKELANEIKTPKKKQYEIYTSERDEALGIRKIVPEDIKDAFYYLAAMNLLNAWINRNGKKVMYHFKTYLQSMIDYIIEYPIEGLSFFIDQKEKLIIFNCNDFQFSFHNIPLSEKMKEYINTERNVEIKWVGKKLQPIASLIFRLAKEHKK